MKEDEYFYWRNDLGIIERHHVSEFGISMDGRPGKPAESSGKDPGEPVSQTRGENPSKADYPKSIRPERTTISGTTPTTA